MAGSGKPKGDRFDLAVIGSGPGGYVAAIRAAQLGLKAAVIERDQVGGICLNWGCIPTKALLRSSELFHSIAVAEEFGLSVESVKFDLAAIVARSRKVASQLSGGINHLLKKNGVTLIHGEARIAGNGEIAVSRDDERRTVRADHIIIATGARPRGLPGVAADSDRIWSYREALSATEVPQSLLVIGSGAIGIEFASFFSTLGAKTTIVEMQDRILPAEDEEISEAARQAFIRKGLQILTGTRLGSIAVTETGVDAKLTGPDGETRTLCADRALLAVGVQPNIENLGLEELGVKLAPDRIIVDEFGATNVPGIHAIGDCAGAPWLAHKASHEGIVCVERIAGRGDLHPLEKSNIPACTYCSPQIASVGLTEAEAKERGAGIKVGRFPLVGNGKAVAQGEAEGFVKTIFDQRTGELLGAHIIGPEATELIHGMVLARSLEATETELRAVVFPHPTLSEALHESVLHAYGEAIHV